MKKPTRLFFARFLRGFPTVLNPCLWALGWVMWMGIPAPGRAQDLVACGGDEVRGLRIDGDKISVMWTWRAAASNLPAWTHPLFSTISECKPLPDGRLLVTSSGGATFNGAVAMVNPASLEASFYARAANAHSADLLPSNRIAVALSGHANGNRLVVFDLSRPDVELISLGLSGGHGVVWDEDRRILWALASYEIRAYQLHNWDSANPSLVKVAAVTLPDSDAHDLIAIPDSPEMMVSTAGHCWLFNRDTRQITPHPFLANVKNVKSLSAFSKGGRLIYIKADVSYWSPNFRLVIDEGGEGPRNLVLPYPELQMYKARWIQPSRLESKGLGNSQAQSQPARLAIAPAGEGLVKVYWPQSMTGYVIEKNPGLGINDWALCQEPVLSDGTHHFVLAAGTQRQCFFRLRKVEP